jgi:acetoin utilization deacetylase AcuC-like enzyme
MAQTGLIYDDVYLGHDTGSHPENAARVRRTYEHLESTGLLDRVLRLKPRPATEEEILLVHTKEYYDHLRSLPRDATVNLDPDTVFGPGSLDAAVYAAGAVTSAVDALREKRCSRVFCLVRPPGHHARPGRAMGFCILNNIAIGAAYAVRTCGLGRAAIIDFDVHHGNGTQEMFYEDESVLYASIHAWPFYPGTGTDGEDGRGAATGKTLNCPLQAGAGEDIYRRVLTERILPSVRAHRPWVILISAGFDAHRADPIGNMALETESFGRITTDITEAAIEVCDGRIISALEGGYDRAALAASVEAHIGALLD